MKKGIVDVASGRIRVNLGEPRRYWLFNREGDPYTWKKRVEDHWGINEQHSTCLSGGGMWLKTERHCSYTVFLVVLLWLHQRGDSRSNMYRHHLLAVPCLLPPGTTNVPPVRRAIRSTPEPPTPPLGWYARTSPPFSLSRPIPSLPAAHQTLGDDHTSVVLDSDRSSKRADGKSFLL